MTSFQVFVKFYSKPTVVVNLNSGDSVEDVKSRIHEKVGVPSELQKVTWHGLDIQQLAASAGGYLQQGMTLDLALCGFDGLKGGMPPKRKAAKAKASSKGTKKSRKNEEEDEDEDEQSDEEEEVVKPSSTRSRPSAKAAEEDEGEGWITHSDTLYVRNLGVNTALIASFDMDHTLVAPKSGKKFPTGRADWTWLFPEVPVKLKKLHQDGYTVVIFSNQGGVEKGNQNVKHLTGKIDDISKALGFELKAFLATATDVNRKPNTTMWKILEEKYLGGVKINYEKSFYCGDAAGRPKEWAPKKPKDFSCGDRAFAHNIKVKFHTPESLFLEDKRDIPFSWDSIDPHEALKKYSVTLYKVPKVEKQEMVLMSGPPASGKSTFYRTHFGTNSKYVWINGDTMGTKAKMNKAIQEALESGKSVVVDNTNPSPAGRAEYLSLAEEAGVEYKRCFVMTTPVELAHHLNFYREKLVAVRRVPDVAYNMFKKNYKEPTKKEGFDEVHLVPFALNFPNEKEKLLFLERTC